MSDFNPATGTMIFAGGGSLQNRSIVKPSTKDFGLRFGFAYSPDEKTVFRGGYGICCRPAAAQHHQRRRRRHYIAGGRSARDAVCAAHFDLELSVINDQLSVRWRAVTGN